MTPPKKKTGSKGSARAKSKSPAKSRAGSVAKSGKSGAKSPAKAASKSGPAKKSAKPGRKKAKKQGRHPAEYIALAFFVGLVFASFVFLFMRQEAEQTAKPAKEAKISARADTKPAAPGPLPKLPPEKAREASRKAEAAKKAAAREMAPKSPLAPPAPPAAPPALSEAQKAERLAERNKAVAGALIDLKSLPYEESLGARLDEQIRQVDYALIQAAWLKKLSAPAMRLASVEDRLDGTEPYHFQVIEILPGKSSKAYLEALKECLSAWAEGAEMSKTGPEQWQIMIRGIQTHIVRLYPGRSSFPPLQDATARVDPTPRDDLGIGKKRLRKPGEEARLVIVIDDLGASSQALRRLLNLNYPVTFAFWPHGAHTRQGAAAAHAAGREILVHQPMEPLGYPKVKPGPNTLLVSMDEEQIRRTLRATLASVPHAVGLNNHMGSRFTQHAPGVDAVLQVLRERGLFMLDSLTHGRSVFMRQARRLGIEHYRRDVFLDVVASKQSVLYQLGQAERIALLTGQAVAIGHPLPETLAALQEWQHTRNRQIRIVRLSDLDQW